MFLIPTEFISSKYYTLKMRARQFYDRTLSKIGLAEAGILAKVWGRCSDRNLTSS